MNFLKLIITLLLIFNLNTVNALNSEEAIIASCSFYMDRQNIDEDSVCYEYINGFIDGAIITDTAIMENIQKEKKEFSDFFKRAYKTRAPNPRQSKSMPATYFAKFCLPENQNKHTIILKLVHSIDKKKLSKQLFKVTLYETMKRTYEC